MSVFGRSQGRTLGILYFLIVVFVASATNTFAQLDPAFGNSGATTTDLFGDDIAIGSFVLPSGKIFVVSSSRSGPQSKYFFVRYNSDGTLDSTYGSNGQQEITIPVIQAQDHRISEAVRQPDGKIILAGFDGTDGIVLRYNENGSIDTTFSGDGVHRPNIAPAHRDGVNAVAVLNDGKILASGFEGDSSFFNNPFLLRYLPNGEVDPSFGIGGYRTYDNISGNTDNGSEIFIQSTGAIVVVNPTEYNTGNIPTGFNVVATCRRFTTNGEPDTLLAFVLSDNYRTVGMQPDDKLLVGSVGGSPPPLQGSNMLDVLVRRFNANGGIDTAFGSGGETKFDIAAYHDDEPSGFQILPDGQIFVSVLTYLTPNRSRFRNTTLSFARLSAAGAINGKFLATSVLTAQPKALNVLTAGNKIVTTYTATNPVSGNRDLLLTRSLGVPLTNPRLRGVPFDFALPTNGIAKPAVYRPGDRNWYINPVFPGYFFGLPGDVLAPSDFIGDFATELAVFRPSSGTWYIATQYQGAATNFITVRWGLAGDIPVPNDYDGDGKSDVAVFRPSDGVWYIRNSADNSSAFVRWGVSGDKPVAGDYDGDGRIDIAVWRPSDGVWYILKSSDGQATVVPFGLNGDIPVSEDYDGDGRTDIAVWRPSEGIWYRLNSSNGSFYAFQWGRPADVPVPADYDGDLKTDISVWRPSDGRWYVLSANGPIAFNWGASTDLPLQARN